MRYVWPSQTNYGTPVVKDYWKLIWCLLILCLLILCLLILCLLILFLLILWSSIKSLLLHQEECKRLQGEGGRQGGGGCEAGSRLFSRQQMSTGRKRGWIFVLLRFLYFAFLHVCIFTFLHVCTFVSSLISKQGFLHTSSQRVNVIFSWSHTAQVLVLYDEFFQQNENGEISKEKFLAEREVWWPLPKSWRVALFIGRTIFWRSRSLTCLTRIRVEPSTSMSSCWSR